MGNTPPTKELSTLEKLHDLCRCDAASRGPNALGPSSWVLQTRYKELAQLALENRAEYLRGGGVCATVTLMLSKLEDEKIQEFCVVLLSQSRPTVAQISLAWSPILNAIKTFPTNTVLQEHGMHLLLRGALSPELEEEALAEIAALRTAARMLLGGAAERGGGGGGDGAPSASDAATAAGPSLCSEVLEALRRSQGRPPALVELWYTTLSLTAHFVSATDVPVILGLLRSVLASRDTPRGILLSCLTTATRMYGASQLHAYDEDVELLMEVVTDFDPDLEVVLHVFDAFAAISRSPSMPNKVAEMLGQVVSVAVQNTGDTADLLPAALMVLARYEANCPAALLASRTAVTTALCHFLEHATEEATVRGTAELVDAVFLRDSFPDAAAAFDAERVVGAVAARVPLLLYPSQLPVLEKWGGLVAAGTPPPGFLGTASIVATLLSGLLVFASDESKRVGASGGASDAVCRALGVVGCLVPAEPAELRRKVLCFLESVAGNFPGLYDRPLARVALRLSCKPDTEPTLFTGTLALLAAVYMREATYWFPDKALMLSIKEMALQVPSTDAVTFPLPQKFRELVYKVKQ